MNDCIWGAIGICKDKCKCNQYISMNTNEGAKLLEEFSRRVDSALEPVREIFAFSYGFKKGGIDNE